MQYLETWPETWWNTSHTTAYKRRSEGHMSALCFPSGKSIISFLWQERRGASAFHAHTELFIDQGTSVQVGVPPLWYSFHVVDKDPPQVTRIPWRVGAGKGSGRSNVSSGKAAQWGGHCFPPSQDSYFKLQSPNHQFKAIILVCTPNICVHLLIYNHTTEYPFSIYLIVITIH